MISLGAGGDGGIRTLDTLLGYAHLANECLQPLGHVSVRAHAARRVYDRRAPVLQDRYASSTATTPGIVRSAPAIWGAAR